jgi:soluble lytic murein transglycosylase-like protein
MSFARQAVVAVCVLTTCPCFSKELIYLTSGFQLEAKSHATQDQTLVLNMADGTMELPASAVAQIEWVPDDPETAPHSVAPRSKQTPEELLTNAATAQGLPPEFVRSVARMESGLNQQAISPKRALGLMQLMPRTAADLGVKPNCSDENAQGGARYLRELLLRYRGDAVLALAAYNAGPGAVSKFRGIPPYSETRRYVERVLREFVREQKLGANHISTAGVHANKPTSTN